jgi:hypothetical protein
MTRRAASGKNALQGETRLRRRARATARKDIGERFLDKDGGLTREVMPDDLHLGPMGYQIWAHAIKADFSDASQKRSSPPRTLLRSVAKPSWIGHPPRVCITGRSTR